MSEWKKVKLGEVGQIKGGKRLPTNSTLQKGSTSHPYIRVRDLNCNRILEITEKFEYIDANTYNQIKNYIVDKGDVVISIVGTIGLVSIIGDTLHNANLTENCAKIINLKGINSVFLYYYLFSELGQQAIKQGTVGAVQQKLPLKNIQSIILSIPPLEEQKAIADVLSALDDKIEFNNKINKNLEEQAQALFKRWFVDFDFPNEDGNPYKSSGGEMVDSELGLIPKDWEVKCLKDFSDITTGKRPLLRVSNQTLVESIPIFGAGGIMGYTNEFILNKKILAIGRVGTHGVIQKINGKSWISDNAIFFETHFYAYVYQNLKCIDYNALNRGSTQPLITQTDIRNLPILKTSIINNYENIAGNMINTIIENEQQNQKLAELRDYLLPKLMSGEIRVNHGGNL